MWKKAPPWLHLQKGAGPVAPTFSMNVSCRGGLRPTEAPKGSQSAGAVSRMMSCPVAGWMAKRTPDSGSGDSLPGPGLVPGGNMASMKRMPEL